MLLYKTYFSCIENDQLCLNIGFQSESVCCVTTSSYYYQCPSTFDPELIVKFPCKAA